METNYCSLCGHENDQQAEICAKCSVELGPSKYRPLAPLQSKTFALTLALCVIFLVASHLVEALESFAFQWQAPATITSGTTMLVSLDSLSELVWPALVLFALGALMPFLSRRATPREGLLLGASLMLVQLLVWIWAANFQVGLLLSSSIQINRTGVILALPSLLFVLIGLALICVGPLAGSSLGGALVERASGSTRCQHCEASLPTKPLPLACKYCHAPVPQPKVHWGFVLLGATLTAGLFSAFLQYGGPSLGFYYRCGFTDTSDQCTEAKLSYGESAKLGRENPWVRITDSRGSQNGEGFFVLYHSWKYTFYLALPFLVAPFLLAFFLQKGALATAGLSIPFSWLVSMLLALLYFDLGSFEGSFLYSLRLHLVALFIWGIAGSIGAMLGYRFGYSPAKAMMEASD